MQSSLPYLGISIDPNLANKTILWQGSDSYERFLKNKEKYPDDLAAWTENSIQYTFNEYAFRSDPFFGEGILFLGCSFTFGIGMIWENTWAYLVAKKLGLKCWNLGIGGASNDMAFRCASYWIPKLKPRYVCYMPTLANRLEIITPDKIERYLPSYEFYSSEDKKFYDKWLSMEENGKLNKEKNIRGIKSICDEIGRAHV